MLHSIQSANGKSACSGHLIYFLFSMSTIGNKQFCSSFYCMSHYILRLGRSEPEFHTTLCSSMYIAQGIGYTTRSQHGTCSQVRLVYHVTFAQCRKHSSHITALYLRKATHSQEGDSTLQFDGRIGNGNAQRRHLPTPLFKHTRQVIKTYACNHRDHTLASSIKH